MNFRPGALLWVICLCAALLPASHAQMLNSERIEQTFGSYGIEVLYSGAGTRVSNLYSEEDGTRTTRTLAVVQYPESLPDELSILHARIVAGESIGATFKAAGWTVHKRFHTLITDVALTDRARNMLQIRNNDEVAVHSYSLLVSEDSTSAQSDADELMLYAGIFEIHHPDYLTGEQLRGIYGPWGELSPSMDELLRTRLHAGLARLEQVRE